MEKYRQLTEKEISTLAAAGCSAGDWAGVTVAHGFDASLISGCRFEGRVRIGAGVRIKDVQECIADYTIEDGATIRGVESLRTVGRTAFGNGTPVAVLNEAGGRQVRIYDTITAQTAYVLAMYRHRPQTVKAIEELIDAYARAVESDMGTMGRGARILNCGVLENVRVGEHALIHGASELTNGTVNSSSDAPTHIGWNVIARDFITASSAEITDGANIEKCFVGQGCVIGKGFTAENSLFFANCQCLCGEAVSVFAGPYTVTHHKSTLLIGGMFSFYNAGSGTNMSNHYYRLGPVHQGVLERGSKTGSGSYMLFPSRIGAFSIVKGRHGANIDTSLLPFSYLIESGEGTVVIPAANLASAGTARDTEKWPRRDNRRGGDLSDIIDYELLNPYTVSRIVEALKILEKPDGVDNIVIPTEAAQKAKRIYTLAMEKYLGERFSGVAGRREAYTEWADIAGLVAPVKVIEEMLDGHYETISDLHKAFARIHDDYPKYERDYIAALVGEKSEKEIAEAGKRASAELLEMQRRDAAKEFSDKMKISYGIDGDEAAREADFENVRILITN